MRSNITFFDGQLPPLLSELWDQPEEHVATQYPKSTFISRISLPELLGVAYRFQRRLYHRQVLPSLDDSTDEPEHNAPFRDPSFTHLQSGRTNPRVDCRFRTPDHDDDDAQVIGAPVIGYGQR